MGMDVYGNKPDLKVGEYFRRNIWDWQVLWAIAHRFRPKRRASVTVHTITTAPGRNRQLSGNNSRWLTNSSGFVLR